MLDSEFKECKIKYPIEYLTIENMIFRQASLYVIDVSLKKEKKFLRRTGVGVSTHSWRPRFESWSRREFLFLN